MKIVVVDGQGGSLGKALVEGLCREIGAQNITAIGTNSTATSAMIKGGAKEAATGENPILVACRDADIIMGPIGIIQANSLLGEITPAMALAIGESNAKKLLVPSSKCNITVVGSENLSMGEGISLAVKRAVELFEKEK